MFSKSKTIIKPLVKTNNRNATWIGKLQRHMNALIAPSGKDVTSSLIDTNLSMYTNTRQFQAYLTNNAYDMSVHNEYDLWPHTNFGTIDNPLLIFSADTNWR